MDLRRYYLIIFWMLASSVAAFGQTADLQIVQSQPAGKDSIYLDFKIRRTSVTPFLMGGYNIVFQIDSAVLDTSAYRVNAQGTFGNVANSYPPLAVYHLQPLVYQLTGSRLYPGGVGTIVPDLTYQDAGRVAFKVKKCGNTGVAFHLTFPQSTVVTWAGDNADLTFSPITPLSVSAKLNPRLPIIVAPTDVCPGKNVTIDTRPGFTNYRLFAIAGGGVVSPVGGPQASPSFVATVSDTTTYFITFEKGASGSNCPDTTTSQKVKLKSAPVKPSITGTTDVCNNQTFAYSVAAPNATSTYNWTLASVGNLSSIVGGASGIGKTQINVNFKASANTVDTVKLVETNAGGCASVPATLPVSVTLCTFKADFTIENSDTAITACQGTKVTFRDVSTITNGTIQKRSWNFGPGASPETLETASNSPIEVIYITPGAASVKLVVLASNGLKDSITKSPTIKVISTLAESPQPSCGTAGCNEVSFAWSGIFGATEYQVRFRKGTNGSFSAYQSTGLSLNYKVTAAMVGGSLAYNETLNDTIYFQVRAIAGKCDTTLSSIVFCKPSYCVTGAGCSLPSFSIQAPLAGCLNDVVLVKATTNPPNFLAAFPSVRISWDNGKFDTAHVYNVALTQAGSQNVKFLIIDTTKVNCYSLNTVSIPVTPVLTVKPDLGIQSLGCDRVTFVWKHVPGATGYEMNYSGCSSGTGGNWVQAPLGGQAEFFELSGLTAGCNINFKVRAIGGCNITQSDTLVTPPICTCYIGHIASSSLTSCAFDTIDLKVTDVQVPNWAITWMVGTDTIVRYATKDSVFRFVPPQPNHNGIGANPQPYHINYIIRDLSHPQGCFTTGSIYDSTSAPGNTAAWTFVKETFCIEDAYYSFNSKGGVTEYKTNYTFKGPGVVKLNDQFYFDPSEAGLGTHSITYNACGIQESHSATVINKPCVSTVVDAGDLSNPNGIYTTCSGVVYITDGGGSKPNSIWRYDGNGTGIPVAVMRSKSSSTLDNGNINNVNFGVPAGIVVDETKQNEVYFVDSEQGKIKKLELDKQKLTTFAGGLKGNIPNKATPDQPIAAARFDSPWGLAIHPNASSLYVFDFVNGNLKSLDLGPSSLIHLLAGDNTNPPLPGPGKSISFLPDSKVNIAADTAGVYIAGGFTGLENYQYSFITDAVTQLSSTNGRYQYLDGNGAIYKLKSMFGISPPLGEWVYFTDNGNFAFRRINTRTKAVETVAGSAPPFPSRNPVGRSGLPFDTRFSSPGPLAFNIKGYIDVLDGDFTSRASVRRYYLPRWGESTWDGFDTTYIANCGRDTISPVYALGRLRVIQGNPNAVIDGTIFAPKDTGTYLLGYYMKIGRCDTTFFKTVKVLPPLRSELKGDSTCLPVATLAARLRRDATILYKWFGPDNKNLAIPVSDTTRVLKVSVSGKYYVQIYFGKAKCSVFDSANVLISPASMGRILPPASIPNGVIYPADSARICFGSGGVTLTMRELTATQPKFKKFLWSTGETSPSIAAMGSGNFIASAIDSLGCEITAKYRVVVQPLPAVCIRIEDITSSTSKVIPYGTYSVSTFAGSGSIGQTDGVGKAASFNQPTGLAIQNDTLWVTDKAGQLIRTVSLQDAKVSTFMGVAYDNAIRDSVSLSGARLKNPVGIDLDKIGNIYVANQGDHTIYKYNRQNGIYANFAGSGVAGFRDSTGSNAFFNQPSEIRIDGTGNLFVADMGNHNIRSIFADGTVTTYAGARGQGSGAVNAKGKNARFSQPVGIGVGPSGHIFVAESFNQTIRRVNLDSIVSPGAGQFTVIGFESRLYNTPLVGGNARFNKPTSVTTDNTGNAYFTDSENGAIRKLDINGNVLTLAGGNPTQGYRDGQYDSASFRRPMGIVLDPKTNDLYVADAGNHVIRKVSRNKTVFICKGSSYRFSDTCRAATSTLVSWQKRDRNGLRALSRGDVAIGFKDTATYIVTIRSSIGNVACAEVKDSIIVKWKSSTKKITLNLDAPLNGQSCRYDTFQLSATTGFSQYVWNEYGTADLNLDTTSVNRVKLVPDYSGFYRFRVIGLDPVSGCFDTSKVDKIVLQAPRPKAMFADTLTCLGNTTLFHPADKDSTGFSYRWDFGDTGTMDVSNKFQPLYKYPKSGTYQVKMVGRGGGGFIDCVDSITRNVTIRPGPISNILVNGLPMDTFKLCGLSGTRLNLSATVSPPSAAAVFKWFELSPKDGILDTSKVGNSTTAQPRTRAGELSSIFGYGVYVNDGGSCMGPPDTLFALLSVSPRFSLVASDTSICRGAPITITAFDSLAPTFKPNDYTYYWDSAGIRLRADSNFSVLNANPLNTVNYRLTMRNKISSCASTHTVRINVSDFRLGLPNIPPPTPCLPADSLPIVAAALGTVRPPLQVQWLDSASLTLPTTLYNPKNLAVKVWRDTLRVYRVHIKDASGCADSAYVRVPASFRQVPLVEIMPNDTGYCKGSFVQVKLNVRNAQSPLTFVWRDGSTGGISREVNITDPFAPVFTPTGSGPKYIVEVQDVNKCGIGRDTIEFTFSDMDLSLTTSQLTGLCRSSSNPNPSVDLKVTTTDFPPQIAHQHSYQWTNITTGQIAGNTDQVIATEAGWYVVEVVNTVTTCVRRDSSYVAILDVPESVTIDPVATTCNNQPLTLKAVIGSPASAKSDSITFTWSIIGGDVFSSSLDSATVFTPSAASTGQIVFQVEAKNRCGGPVMSTLPVTFLQGAIADLEASPLQAFIDKDVVFTNRSLNTDSMNILVLGDGTVTNFGFGQNESFTYVYQQAGQYVVKLYALTTNGCNSVDTVVIDVSDKRLIYVPNVFSPLANHDENRTFRIFGANMSASNFSLSVYNKWGQLEYSTTDLSHAMNIGWDGTGSLGEAQGGVYTYVIKGKFGDGREFLETGTVTLLR